MNLDRLDMAASFLAYGQYREAIHCFDLLLVDMKKYFLVQRADVELNVTSSTTLVPHAEAYFGPPCSLQTYASEFPVFGRIVLIRRLSELIASDITDLDVAIITVAVLFNKGLALHLLGNRRACSTSCNPYIKRARKLYQKAYALLVTCSPSHSKDSLLKAALMSNLGQICSLMHDRTGEQTCLANAQHLLSHLGESSICREGEMELRLNVMLLLGSHRPSPAA